MRIVADTNVLVSARIFPGGLPEAVYRLGLEERLALVPSRPLLAELGGLHSDQEIVRLPPRPPGSRFAAALDELVHRLEVGHRGDE